ncbi:hypothetical protein KSF_108870 [Reticulibacter mediterranei]|uniref:Uncharacterized protein n=1 Tax=Reticulibacter mediterranei TaxID=2778369 RepID=A0A8J3N753_9CHLR|nr:hypothetical protein [Reticulibacter mediterranei]GHP00840.1 hypothetical protein KSF_108870 [Reticulibacter mediterranei]
MTSPTVSTNAHLEWRDGGLYCQGCPVVHLLPAPKMGELVIETEPPLPDHQAICGEELLFAMTGQKTFSHAQGERWLHAYIHVRTVFSGLLDQLFFTTPTARVLGYLDGGADLLDTLEDIKKVINTLPLQVSSPGVLYATCILARLHCFLLLERIEQICPSTYLQHISGGSVVIQTLKDLRLALVPLPSLALEKRPQATVDECPSSTVIAPDDTKDERALLFGEIMKRIELQDTLFLAGFFGGVSFLGICLQPGVDGHTGFLLPIALSALMLKHYVHNLRIGQIGFYLRFVLKSRWEVTRRHLFSKQTLSSQEDQTFDAHLLKEAQKLTPFYKHIDMLASQILFSTLSATALIIASQRTYDQLFSHPFTLSLWILSYGLAAASSCFLAVKKRVR